MVKYENSKIYKIVDNTNGNIYIGSTVKTLSQRLGQHRTAYKMFLDGKRGNVKSFEIIKNGDYDIILLEECKDITNKEQLYARERYYIDSLECVNKVIPGKYLELGQKEYSKGYYVANKEEIKQYYQTNKQYLSEKLLCPHCGISFRRDNKTQHLRSKTHQINVNNQANTE